MSEKGGRKRGKRGDFHQRGTDDCRSAEPTGRTCARGERVEEFAAQVGRELVVFPHKRGKETGERRKEKIGGGTPFLFICHQALTKKRGVRLKREGTAPAKKRGGKPGRTASNVGCRKKKADFNCPVPATGRAGRGKKGGKKKTLLPTRPNGRTKKGPRSKTGHLKKRKRGGGKKAFVVRPYKKKGRSMRVKGG